MSDREDRAGRYGGPTPPPTVPDEEVVFIGRITTPWESRADCPRNVRAAREAGGTALLDLEPVYRPGLHGLSAHSHLIVLYWMDEAERDVMIQYPRHAAGPRGVFSIRSPARPNPIALAVARILSIDAERGQIEIEQIDCRNGTAIIDIKPYFPSVDAAPEATNDATPTPLDGDRVHPR
ncbi:tRNA (N6-threonylcarbamoyladenosine(37)-N6)-methyltransferase TrmO [Methylobrevis pamukkalensis]|uniref:S-adenosyl-L-methionine-binding protein n=1 Tax=Methylobrevis pamukkalensis TaxID=1439726 RepID=A0A1E3H160_9HYPH|nr:tRNA (N6-threonylcarbamoyladenosine(37)-N6)-methyltransferase TrmO [Methylobrevis pamukkalensis]ODN70063.1 S-adenosyl-L-methionine-binding protein [Methylobrevis pamukkalensis]